MCVIVCVEIGVVCVYIEEERLPILFLMLGDDGNLQKLKACPKNRTWVAQWMHDMCKIDADNSY